MRYIKNNINDLQKGAIIASFFSQKAFLTYLDLFFIFYKHIANVIL